MDQAPQPEDAAEIAREERRADVQRRIDEVAGVLAETPLGMWRAKHRADGSVSRMAPTRNDWRQDAFATAEDAEKRRAQLESMNPGSRFAVVAL